MTRPAPPGESQPVAMENKIRARQTRVTQLERDLAVAHARIQDHTEINSFLRRTALRLDGVTANILNYAIDEVEPEADDVASVFLLLDDSF